jgi:hypothetical protein
MTATATRAYWFGETDALPLVLYRIGFGTLLFTEAIHRLSYTTELFSSEGFHLPAIPVPIPGPAGAFWLVVASGISALALAVGARSRIAAVVTALTWAWLYCIDQINERALHSIVIMVAVLLAISDSGTMWSLDAKRLGTRVTAWATPLRLLQLQFAQIYFFAGVGKLYSEGWVEGEVLHRSMSSRWATPLGLWVAHAMPTVGWRALGLSTILYEMVGTWLLFVPWARRYVIAVGFGFHIGIELCLHVGWLGWHFALTLFTDPAWLRLVISWLQQRVVRRTSQ